MLLILNTYENSKNLKNKQVYPQKANANVRRKLYWTDEDINDKSTAISTKSGSLIEIIQYLELKKSSDMRKKDFVKKAHRYNKSKKGL